MIWNKYLFINCFIFCGRSVLEDEALLLLGVEDEDLGEEGDDRGIEDVVEFERSLFPEEEESDEEEEEALSKENE